ncbi:MAG TPA: HAMP domain-containing sensor histidine kinase, partial [Pyrinomonadaceae bacterium]|nr:HAMP domain-containing sensor histidine kinase [Pyrinomonadaceae bacterium]
IRLGVSMLRDSITDAEALSTIELVERGIRHLNKLVVDVTQFSRQKALERSRVNLHELLDVSLDLVSESVREKQTLIEKKLSQESLVGNWDGHQLRQVFVNLISNAIEASTPGSPVKISSTAITAATAPKGTEKKYARVTVTDRGKGMDPTTLNRIFEPFYSTKKRGTGLGLAIVRQIVEQHDGRIAVESEVGNGTRFVVDLPL